MAETYTIESAEDGVMIDPRYLRELRDLLRADDDLDLGVKLRDRPPAPGEQGAIPVALEIVAAVTPLGTAFTHVLTHWIDKNRPSIRVRRKGGLSVELSGVNVHDAARLIDQLERGTDAGLDDGA